MEKDQESITTVTIKPDYAPSEVYSSEPPPAYPKSQSSAVQVAKIIAVTLVLMSVVLGSFLLGAAYVTANASCRQFEQELEILSEAADRFQPPPQPEALIRENPHKMEEIDQNLKEEPEKAQPEDSDASSESEDSESSDASDLDEAKDSKMSINFKLPLQLDFDDLAGALIAKNQKSRMNCVVEKKRAEQVVDHQPKTINLPFGLNITTDPKYEHISGERMAIFCESGKYDKEVPEKEEEEPQVMVQPVMIPIPQSHFPTHMAQQALQHPMVQMQQQLHPIETMQPPVAPQEDARFPPNQVLRQIAEEIIAQNMMENRMKQQEQTTPERRVQELPLPLEVLSHLSRLPQQNVIVAVSRPQEVTELRRPELRIIAHRMQFPDENSENIEQRAEEPQEQKDQDAAPEEMRPHFVQPRSVRSVDAVLPKSQKRVKRCSCDCAC